MSDCTDWVPNRDMHPAANVFGCEWRLPDGRHGIFRGRFPDYLMDTDLFDSLEWRFPASGEEDQKT